MREGHLVLVKLGSRRIRATRRRGRRCKRAQEEWNLEYREWERSTEVGAPGSEDGG